MPNRTAPSLLSALLAAAAPSALLAAGTASISPDDFDRGDAITILYDATGGPLAGASPVHLHHGFNEWTQVVAVDPAMTSTGANTWSHTIAMPANRTQIDFVFRNAAGTVYDNNNGADWHFTVDLSDYELGSTIVPAAQGGGVVFRVWAPDASSAVVRGQFNGFNDSNPMALDLATGIWTAWVNDAVVGQRYKYYLNGATWRKDPRARRVNNSNGDSFIYDPAAYNWGSDAPVAVDMRDAVIYEMHIGAWEDGTDNVAPGTFADAITRLDYLVDLGVNVVEILPVNEFAGNLSGGYNPADPFAVETAYGSADGFKTFVKACHERGLAVILDIVHNHYGPADLDLYGFGDDGASPGIYFYDSPPALAESGFGPRPDYSEPQVRSFILDNVRMLLDEYRVDGFRWDFTKGIRGTLDGSFNVVTEIPEGISLLREANDLTHTYAGRLSFAEDLANEPRLVAPTTEATGFGFDSQWNVAFHSNVVGELDDADADRTMSVIAAQIPGDLKRIHYLESHDETWALNGKDRVPKRIDSANPTSLRARKSTALGAGVLFASEGIPMIFQGQEWGETERWSENTGMDWSRISTPPYSGMNALHRDLIHLRRNLKGTTRGLMGDTTNVYLVLEAQKVLAWRRTHIGGLPGDDVVVLANFSATNYPLFDIGFPSAGAWHEHFNSDSTEYGMDYTSTGVGQTVTTVSNPLHGFAQRGTVAVGPYSMVILSKAEPAAEGSLLSIF